MSKENVLTFVGDVFYPEDTGERFSAKNIVYNQEFVVSKDSRLKPSVNKVNLKCSSDMAGLLFENTEKRYACTANNHIFDYGEEGFRQTIQNLSENGVNCFGEGLSDIAVFELSGIKFSLLGYFMEAFCRTEQIDQKKAQLRKDIEAAKQKGAERIVVNFHFGNEHYPSSSIQQRKIAQAAIDEGADLVIGHHPHCIQEKENYKGKWIYYSLGNFIFPNFACDAFFNESGISQARFNWKNTFWTRDFIVVEYDLKNNETVEMVCRWTRKGIKRINRRRIDVRDTDFKNQLIGEVRKLILLFYWNINVNGKLIDFSGIKQKIVSVMKNNRLFKRK